MRVMILHQITHSTTIHHIHEQTKTPRQTHTRTRPKYSMVLVCESLSNHIKHRFKKKCERKVEFEAGVVPVLIVYKIKSVQWAIIPYLPLCDDKWTELPNLRKTSTNFYCFTQILPCVLSAKPFFKAFKNREHEKWEAYIFMKILRDSFAKKKSVEMAGSRDLTHIIRTILFLSMHRKTNFTANDVIFSTKKVEPSNKRYIWNACM